MYIKTVITESQIKAIESLAYKIWYEYYIPIIGKSQVDYMLEKFQSSIAIKEQINNGFLYFVSEHDNVPVGYMSVNIHDDALFLSKFYVRKVDRGKGYGKKMIEYLESLTKDKNLNKISLTVNKYNTRSIKMYEKFGFSICNTIVQDIGKGFVMDDYQMEKSV